MYSLLKNLLGKNGSKPILAVVLLAISFLKGYAQEACINGITYNVISENEAEVKAKQYYSNEVIRVAQTVTINGKKYVVTKIGSSAFSAKGTNVNLTREIILPESIKNIGGGAFSSNKSLVSINLPDGIQKIPFGAFEFCEALKTIDIPSSVTEIGGQAFDGCTSLADVILPDGLTTIGNHAFSHTIFTTVLRIPDNVSSIEMFAFSSCKALKEIIVPSSVKKIEKGAFCLNENLEKVVLPDEMESVSPDAFNCCWKLREIRGTNIKYPRYIIEGYWDSSTNNMPFMKDSIPVIKKKFSYYGDKRVRELIEAWQTKMEFETTAQWKSRVTEQNRLEKLKVFIRQARDEFIEKWKPGTVNTYLDRYNADYNVYTVKVNGGGFNGNTYAQVPLSDAQTFKEKWNKVKVTPVYGVVNDLLGIVSCTFKLGSKVYQSPATYSNEDASGDLAVNLPPLEINLSGAKAAGSRPADVHVDNSIDSDIPHNPADNVKTFAVIIGNENYSQVEKVEYAKNDAKVFADYCKKTLGLPVQNVSLYEDATYGAIISALQRIKDIAEAYSGDLNVIFYYAGHGVPDETSKDAYILPVDADGTQTEVCLATKRLYKELSALNAHSVVVFMDACFSGAQRGDGMLASARGVALKVNEDRPQGNIVVFSAATGEQTAYPFKEGGHGLFTYFLLKKLQETKGDVTLGELSDYISTQVNQHSVVKNHKKQTPTAVSSPAIADRWRGIKLK